MLVDEFHAPFHSEQIVLQVYKKELHNHVEACLGSNLRARLSTALALNMETSQKEMAGNHFLLYYIYFCLLQNFIFNQRSSHINVVG